MASPAVHSQNACIYRGDGATPTEAFTAITGVNNLEIGATSNRIPVTDLCSTRHEYIRGLEDVSNISFQLFYAPDNATHELILDDFDSEAKTNYQIQFKNVTPTITWDFEAQVEEFSISIATDEALTASVTLVLNEGITRP